MDGRSTTLSSKQEIRNAIRLRRRGLSAGQVAALSLGVTDQALQTGLFSCCRTVALYLPVDQEVETSSLLLHLDRLGKTLFIPVVMPGNRLDFGRYRPGDPVRMNRFGIPEPAAVERASLTEIDLFVLPLVGFDRRGCRLGYGGGYYDRTLSDLALTAFSPVLLGLAYDFQEIPCLPQEAHDVPLQYVVTQSGVRTFS